MINSWSSSVRLARMFWATSVAQNKNKAKFKKCKTKLTAVQTHSINLVTSINASYCVIKVKLSTSFSRNKTPECTCEEHFYNTRQSLIFKWISLKIKDFLLSRKLGILNKCPWFALSPERKFINGVGWSEVPFSNCRKRVCCLSRWAQNPGYPQLKGIVKPPFLWFRRNIFTPTSVSYRRLIVQTH